MNNHYALGLAGGLALCSAQAQAAGSNALANNQLRITVSDHGKLESVENRLAQETYRFNADVFAIDTDMGLFSNRQTQPASVTAHTQRLVYH